MLGGSACVQGGLEDGADRERERESLLSFR